MATTENIEVEVSIDKKQVDKEFNDLRDDIKWFKKRLDSDEATDLALNVSLKEQDLRKARERLRKAVKEGNEEAEIEIRTDITKLSQELTGAKRELRNFARTGEKDVSVLWKLFDSVNSEIAKSRQELQKLWKSTKVLDRLEKEINDLNKEFSKGKLSVTAYQQKLTTLQSQLPKAWGAFDGVKKSVKALGVAFVAWLGINTLINFTKDAVKAFAEFEKGLSRINTVAGVTEQELKGLGNEITIISKEFGIAKDELLDTAFNITSAGVEFENVSKILKLSSVVALGAFTDTTTAFNGIIAVIKKFGEDLNTAGDIAEKFFIANKLGQTTIEDLANAIQNLTSSVKPAWVEINEVFAILSTLTGVTWNANQVITQLNGAISALASPTTEASAKFKELGIEVGQTAIAEKGLVEVAKDVFDATDGNLELLRKLIPEIEAQKLVVALATTQYDKFKLSLDEVTNSQGNLQEAVNQVTNDTAFQLEVASRKYEDFKKRAGNSLVSIFGFLVDLWSILKSTGKIIVSFVSSWVIAITSLAVAFSSAFKDIKNNFSNFTKIFTDFSIQDVISWNFTFPEVTFTNLKGTGKEFSRQIGIFSDVIDEEFTNITDTINGKSKETKLAVDELLNDIQGTSQTFWSAVWISDTETTNTTKNINKISWASSKAIQKAEKEKDEAEKAEQKRIKTRENFLKKQKENEVKIVESAQKEIDSAINNSEDKVKDYQAEIEKIGDSFVKFKEKATENLQKVDAEILALDKNRSQSIAERAVEIEKEIKALKDKSKFEGDDALKLQKLQKELKIARSNTNNEAIKEAKRISELSTTELILEEIQAEKTRLEEKKKSIEIDLDLEKNKANSEIEVLENKISAEKVIIQELADVRIKTEQLVTERLTEEANKQIAMTDKVIAKVKRLIALKQQAWLWSWTVTTPDTSSASTSSNWWSNTNVTVDMWGVTVTNEADEDRLVDKVTEKIVEASQNADAWIL